MNKFIIILLSFALASTAYAGGYRVSLQGQKALAMGHTGVAMSDSSEVVFFNPGAMTQLEADTDISGGLSLLTASTIYQNEQTNATAETEDSLGTPVYGYIAKKISEDLSWGLGIYTPYGNKVAWPTDWEGSHLVNYIELQTIYIQPTIGYQINDSTSVGFGPNLVIGAVEFNRNLSTSLSDGTGRSNVTIEASNVTAWGFNLGLLHKVSEQVSLGASYRSEVTLEARDGDATFRNIPGPLQPGFPDGGFSADLVLPAEFTIGIAYHLNPGLTLAFDINRTFWSAYDALIVEFEAPLAGTSVNPRNYQDSNIYRFGLQYQASESWILRGGIYFDQTPIQAGYFSPETPRNDAIGYTAGASYRYSEKLEFDFSFLLLTFDEFTGSYDYYEEFGTVIPFGGDYDSVAMSFGFGVNYRY